MQVYHFIASFVLLFFSCAQPENTGNEPAGSSSLTPFEKNDQTTATYEEAIDFYSKLHELSGKVRVNEFGDTDIGLPLHEVILSKSGVFSPETIRKEGKMVLFINNGIHAGEPCGIDASMILARDLLTKGEMQTLLDKVVVVIIPVYNIGGALNRGSFSRANQVGPLSYGFRGNAKNLDLNRDFIKGDSRNSISFQKLFAKWSPDVFIDNHTSNGADYPYVLTLIASQKDKLTKELSDYMVAELLPDLYQKMATDKYEMTPYVYSRESPDEGIFGFMDSPRYSSGYAALHHCFSFISEAHMLKDYKDRVWATYHFMKNMLIHMNDRSERMLEVRESAIHASIANDSLVIDWTLDMTSHDTLQFKGYEAKYKKSEVTGHDRLYYDRTAPYTKTIQYFNTYRPAMRVKKPYAYIVPRAYRDIVQRMVNNGVEVQKMEEDTVLQAEHYYIDDFQTSERPYEAHYIHSRVKVTPVQRPYAFSKGDYIIRTNQVMVRYIIETLEPQAPDSWFAWNFFDGILMQKEYFSAYVFEDTAAKLLAEDADLKERFENRKKSDKEFADNPGAQLDFIYKNSPYYEKTHRLYPVARIHRPY